MKLIAILCDYLISQIMLTDAKTALIERELNSPPETTGPDDSDDDQGEPQPQGNNFADTQISYQSDRNHELNGNDRPGHYGRAISMKWWPKDEPH